MAEPIKTKTCTTCKQIKPIAEFYKNGRSTKCKVCEIQRQRAYNKTQKGRESQKRYDQSKKGRRKKKLWRKTPKGKASFRTHCDPERIKASKAVNNAVSAGDLPHVNTLICQNCPDEAQHYHHHKGYAPEHWLDVVPLCIECHIKVHSERP